MKFLSQIYFFSSLFGLAPAAQPQYTTRKVNNNVGILIHEESSKNISNDQRTNFLYYDFNPIKKTIDNNDKIREIFNNIFNKDVARMITYKLELEIQIHLIANISVNAITK